MAGRCGCASDRCACHFIAGDGVIISGTGTRSNPYVFQVTVSGDGGDGGGGTGGGTRIPGEIIEYGGAAAPPGWLICDGSLVDRGAFPDLFNAIGTAYGPGDGLTTFQLPDFSGRMGVGASQDYPRGTSGGTDSYALTLANLPAHSHSMTHTHSINHDHGRTGNGGDHSHTAALTPDSGTHENRARSGAAGTVYNSGSSFMSASGPHDHNIPSHSGNSGASSNSNTGIAGSASPTALDNMPPYTAVTKLIKT